MSAVKPLVPAVLTRRQVVAARTLAAAADLVQIVAFPLFGEGFASPWNDALDVAVGAALTWLLGWHWSFLPTFAAELVPLFDLVPTWSAAVLIATRGGAPPPSPPVVTKVVP